MRDIKFRMWHNDETMIDGDSLAFEEYEPLCQLLSQDNIMQYTGLKDISGKEVYEDDIIECETEWNFYKSDMIGKIIFSNGCFKIKGNVLKNTNNIESVFSLEEIWNIKIIGNIYENPELLNV